MVLSGGLLVTNMIDKRSQYIHDHVRMDLLADELLIFGYHESVPEYMFLALSSGKYTYQWTVSKSLLKKKADMHNINMIVDAFRAKFDIVACD